MPFPKCATFVVLLYSNKFKYSFNNIGTYAVSECRAQQWRNYEIKCAYNVYSFIKWRSVHIASNTPGPGIFRRFDSTETTANVRRMAISINNHCLDQQLLSVLDKRRLVRPSVSYGLVTRKQKRHREIKISTNDPRGTSKWNANFQLKRSKVKVTGRQKPQEIAAYLAYTFTYGRQCRRSRHHC